MKRSLLFILAAMLTNVIIAQSIVEITPPAPSVTVNAQNTPGATVTLNVKLLKEFSIPVPNSAPIVFSGYSKFSFSSAILSSTTAPSAPTPYYTNALTVSSDSALKKIICTIPNTALAGQSYSLIVNITDGTIIYSGIAEITVAQVLPITWSSFNAVQKEKNIALSWTTESEKDNSHFIVERSTNGTDFNSIGEIKAVGNSNTTNKYQFEDSEASNSVNYYRIRAISLEGISDISKVISVVKKGSFDVKTFLTAQGARVQISADQIGEEATLQLINLNGQVVSSKQIKIDASLTDTEIDFQEKGVFIVNVKTDTKSISKKLLKY